jgi:hypothetical protein
LVFPVKGYIWNTVEKAVTHSVLIDNGSKTFNHSERGLAEEMDRDLRTLGLHDNSNSPLQRFLVNEGNVLTRLKLTEFERLHPVKKLEDFRLRNGNTLKTGPQGFCWVAPT